MSGKIITTSNHAENTGLRSIPASAVPPAVSYNSKGEDEKIAQDLRSLRSSLSSGPQPMLVVFRPAGPAGVGVVNSWEDLMAVIEGSEGPLQIHFDVRYLPGGVFEVPAGIHDMKGAKITNDDNTASSISVLSVPDGARLRNLARIGGCLVIQVASNTVGVPGLDWTDVYDVSPDYFWPTLWLDEYSVLRQAGSQPAIIVDPVVQVGFTLEFSGHSWFSYTGSARTVRVKSNSLFEFTLGPNAYPNWTDMQQIVESEDASVAVFVSNGQKLFQPGILFPGVPTQCLCYDKFVGDAFTTAEFNLLKNNTVWNTGDWYYDVTLGKRVTYNGTIWVTDA